MKAREKLREECTECRKARVLSLFALIPFYFFLSPFFSLLQTCRSSGAKNNDSFFFPRLSLVKLFGFRALHAFSLPHSHSDSSSQYFFVLAFSSKTAYKKPLRDNGKCLRKNVSIALDPLPSTFVHYPQMFLN